MSSPATGTALKQQPTADVKAAEWRRIPGGRTMWLVHQGLSELDLATVFGGVEQPAVFLRPPKAGSISTVFKFSRFVAKRYHAPTLRERIKALVRGPRARRALDWATKLTALDVPTIRPVAVAYRRGQPWDSCIVSCHIEDRSSVHEFVASLDASLDRRRLVNALAETMARLHNAGISHGDAHLANFIVERAHPPRLVLVDLDALRFRKISATVAAKDLKRLLDYAPGSQSEHLRFLLTYARRRTPPMNTRELLRHLRAQRRGPGALHDAP